MLKLYLDKHAGSHYSGRYYSNEVDQSVSVEVDTSHIVIRNLKYGEIKMTPYTTDVFRSGISFFDRIRFERDSNHQVRGFIYLGSRASEVFFEKIH